jgi:diguanylate cyclase (GGDEF)-like protein
MARVDDPVPHLLLRKVGRALLPSLALVAVALVVLAYADRFGEHGQLLLGWVPLALTGAAMLAALHFNRSRAFFASLSVMVAWLGLDHYDTDFAFHAVSVFLPLNLVLFALIRERGIFTKAGSLRFLLVFLQLVFTALLVSSGSEKLLWLLTVPLFESGLTRALAIAPPALLMMLVALLWLHGRMVLEPTPERAAFFAATIAVVLALSTGHTVPWTGTLLGAAGAIFLVGLLQTSWRMAYLDELTSIPGRRALEEQLMRLDEPYAIAMVDVDHFKEFNDTWGHDAGDEVLRMVAVHLERVGGGGKSYRYGGEEFTVVFAGKQVRDTLAALGALRKDIEQDEFVVRARDRQGEEPEVLRITVSIGVADSERYDTPQEVMGAADAALYRAKDSGRNQVCR